LLPKALKGGRTSLGEGVGDSVGTLEFGPKPKVPVEVVGFRLEPLDAFFDVVEFPAGKGVVPKLENAGAACLGFVSFADVVEGLKVNPLPAEEGFSLVLSPLLEVAASFSAEIEENIDDIDCAVLVIFPFELGFDCLVGSAAQKVRKGIGLAESDIRIGFPKVKPLVGLATVDPPNAVEEEVVDPRADEEKLAKEDGRLGLELKLKGADVELEVLGSLKVKPVEGRELIDGRGVVYKIVKYSTISIEERSYFSIARSELL
jgi:hypothetical protein